QQWGFMLVFSLVSVLGPFSCYFAGLQHLEPTRAIVASCLEPVFSILIAALVLGELLRPMQTVGIVLVLVAIVLIQLPERAARGEELVVEPIESEWSLVGSRESCPRLACFRSWIGPMAMRGAIVSVDQGWRLGRLHYA